jgi:hypothetical protein
MLQSESLKRSDYLIDLGLDRRIILKWIIKKYGMRTWTEFTWLRIGSIDWFL